jgi:hypothetical protein
MLEGSAGLWFLVSQLLLCGWILPPAQVNPSLPSFGRDTVLVYRSSNEKEGAFVVRIAKFSPERYVEWEDTNAQGTVLMTTKAVNDARELVSFRLFQAGVDTSDKNATTLWLSRRMYRELKTKPKAKFAVDGIATAITMLGNDQLTIEVNRSPQSVPVIKTKDERGAERWFIDLEENPLMVNLLVRDYRQKLVSITTDRPNSLRWIKDKKLKQVAAPDRRR